MRLLRNACTLILTLIVVTVLLQEPTEAALGEPLVRVLLLERQETVKITGSMEITGLKEPILLQGEKLFTRPEVQETVQIVPDSGFLAVNGLPYRGEILIKSKPDGLLVINRVEMENYLFGVLACEVNPEWPFEMLKAQAVAARCFALVQSQTKISQDFDLYADTRSQVYKGMGKEHPRTNEAVKQTRGIVALYQDQVIQAVFSAASGGKTANSEDVWGKSLPYLRSVPDYDQACPYASWKTIVSAQELDEKLKAGGVDVGSLKNLITVERDSSDRVKSIRIVGERGRVVLAGTQFRSMFNLKSTNFVIVNAPQLSPESSTNAGQGIGTAGSGNGPGTNGSADLSGGGTGTDGTNPGGGNGPGTGGRMNGGGDNGAGWNGSVIGSGADPAGTDNGTEDGETGTTGRGAAGTAPPRDKEELANEKGLAQTGSAPGAIAVYLFTDSPTGSVSLAPQADLPGFPGSDQNLAQAVLTALPLVQLEVAGSGYGHGVGMSQWGAREMAALGATFKQILCHYYQGIEIVRLY